MSQHVDPDLSFVALDGDAFRAPEGTTLPPIAAGPPVTGPLDALAAPWLPFGGVEAGLSLATEVDQNQKRIWNAPRGSIYRTITRSEVKTITFRAVEHSEATVKTIQRGGSATEVGSPGSGVFKWTENPSGNGEVFAFAFDVRDGDKHLRYFFERVELAGVPTEVYDGEDIVGWDITLTVLVGDDGAASQEKYSNFDPTVTAA